MRGTAANTDTPLTGAMAAQALTGLSPDSPLIASDRYSRIRTRRGGPANLAGTPEGRHLDDWRDAFNPNSPAMWILVLLVVALGLMQIRVSVGGKRGFKGGLG